MTPRVNLARASKVLVADRFHPSLVKRLKASDRGLEVTEAPGINAAQLPVAIADHDVLMVRSTKVEVATLDAAERLQWVIRGGSGYNTIAWQEAAARGVAVSNSPNMNADAVAELAIALLLSLIHI